MIYTLTHCHWITMISTKNNDKNTERPLKINVAANDNSVGLRQYTVEYTRAPYNQSIKVFVFDPPLSKSAKLYVYLLAPMAFLVHCHETNRLRDWFIENNNQINQNQLNLLTKCN